MKYLYKFVSILSLAFLLTACGSDSEPDTDGDGVPDSSDVFPNDRTESKDTDGDGVGDNGDAFPEDPNETLDSDNDSVGDNADAFPQDPNETLDTDNDGVGDNGDAFPEDPAETLDTDNDGLGNNADPNDDNDGELDGNDAFPLDPTETEDADQDGIGDNKDLDLTSTEKNSIQITRLNETLRATRFIGPFEEAAKYIPPAVETVGDINNDGYEDLAVSYTDFPKGNFRAGILYIFFGEEDLQWPKEIDLANIPETVNHIRFERQTDLTAHWDFGVYIEALGDIDGDEIDDFAISSALGGDIENTGTGMLHIVFGRETWLEDAGDDKVIAQEVLFDSYAMNYYGAADMSYNRMNIAKLGDVNGDGLNDFSIVETQYEPPSGPDSHRGRIIIFLGGTISKPTAVEQAYSRFDDIPEANRIQIIGSQDFVLGWHDISPLGNFDNDADNLDDFLIRRSNGTAGYVILSNKTWANNLVLDDLIPNDGFTLSFDTSAAMTVGNLVTVEGESNPATKDILVSVSAYGGGDDDEMFIFKGGVGSWPAELNEQNISDFFALKLNSDPENRVGFALRMYPDSNGDGFDEPLAWTGGPVGEFDRVQRFIGPMDWEGDVFDRTSVNDRIQLVHNNIQTSFKEISITGDFDGDGLVEWVLGRSDAETLNGTDSGDFFVIKGFSEVYD